MPAGLGCGERSFDSLFVDLVAAGGRDHYFDKRDPERVRLVREKLTADPVDADPVVGLGDRRDQRFGFSAVTTERPEGERGVLAATPGQCEAVRVRRTIWIGCGDDQHADESMSNCSTRASWSTGPSRRHPILTAYFVFRRQRPADEHG